MQGTPNQTKSGSDSIMPFSKDSSNKDETSGLHDLQAMASSAKRRRSQRLSTQIDAQESLLRSTAALDTVVLPDPNKEQEVSIDTAAVEAKATGTGTSSPVTNTNKAAAASPVTELAEESSSSSGKGVYVAFALVAAVAAGVYFFLFSSKSSSDTQVSAKPVAAAVVDIAEPDPTPEPAADPSVDPGEEQVEPEVSETEPAAATDPVVPAKEETDKPSNSNTDSSSKTKGSKAEKAKAEKAKAEKAKAEKAKAEKPKVAAAKEKPEKATKTEPKAEKKPDPNASLDDVLSSVTGGVDKPIAKETGESKPTKTSLSRGDIAKAMGKVKGAAKSCYKVEEFSGMVKVKYSVAPDGSVIKASATGAHKSSPTGACVVKAAKKAKFPPYSGAAMSSTFPFLLAP